MSYWRQSVKKLPFLTLAIFASTALLLAFLAKMTESASGAMLLRDIAMAVLIMHAIVRIVFDLIPKKYLRNKTEGVTA